MFIWGKVGGLFCDDANLLGVHAFQTYKHAVFLNVTLNKGVYVVSLGE